MAEQPYDHVGFLRGIGVHGTNKDLDDVAKLMPGYEVSEWTGKRTVWNPKKPCPSCGSPRNEYGRREHCWGWMYYQEPCFPEGTWDLPLVSKWESFLAMLLLFDMPKPVWLEDLVESRKANGASRG